MLRLMDVQDTSKAPVIKNIDHLFSARGEAQVSTPYKKIGNIIIIIIIKDNVYGAVIVTYSHCESSPGSF